MEIFNSYKFILNNLIIVFVSFYFNVVSAESCVIDEASDDFLIPNECTVGGNAVNALEFFGIGPNDLRFGKVDEISGNTIRIGAANHTVSIARLIFDTSEDDCASSNDVTDIEENDEIAFFTIQDFFFNNAIIDQRPVNIIWILDCEIVQDR